MPEQIGPYQILEELGRGAMGVVFRGLDPSIGRPVAIKVIRSQEFSTADENAAARLRFTREASAAGRLSHPNIVTVYQLGEERGFQYLAMELVPGASLEKLMVAGTPMNVSQALGILRPIADALDHAHSEGVVHRDIKPANILVRPDGRVKITDFGIARVVSQTLTQTGQTAGTPHYMSPEQILSSKVDGRADQFSLAVMAYELLSGRKPFEADAPHALMLRIMSEEAQPVHEVNPALPRECAPVFGRALAKKAAARYATCTDFIQALTTSVEVKPVPSEPSGPALATFTRRPIVIGPLALVLLALGLSFTWWYRSLPDPLALVVTEPGRRPRYDPVKMPETREIDVKTNSKDGLPYAFIPAGRFQMGCSPDDKECRPEEKPPHRVTISRSFWMGQTEVTVEAYRLFTTATGKSFPRETSLNPGWANNKMPMVNVDWNDAKGFCVWSGGRLPTEAQWEYATRAETTGARYADLDSIAWYSGNSHSSLHSVAQKAPNAYGLYDMLGNVWEWTADGYNDYGSAELTEPTGSPNGSYRVLRGGSWHDDSRDLRAAYRRKHLPELRYDVIGFRCAREAIL